MSDCPPPAPAPTFVRIADLTDLTLAALRRVNGEQAGALAAARAEADGLRERLEDVNDALDALRGQFVEVAESSRVALERERQAVGRAHDALAEQVHTIGRQAREIAELKRRIQDMSIDLDGTTRERDDARKAGR